MSKMNEQKPSMNIKIPREGAKEKNENIIQRVSTY